MAMAATMSHYPKIKIDNIYKGVATNFRKEKLDDLVDSVSPAAFNLASFCDLTDHLVVHKK
jgi:hypothetical protein